VLEVIDSILGMIKRYQRDLGFVRMCGQRVRWVQREVRSGARGIGKGRRERGRMGRRDKDGPG